MKDLKITKGVWEVKEFPLNNDLVGISGGRNVCKMLNWDEESEANARLIAEAGNVTNETGLTPRELLNQRNELLEALNLINGLCADASNTEFPKINTGLIAKISIIAIKKATE